MSKNVRETAQAAQEERAAILELVASVREAQAGFDDKDVRFTQHGLLASALIQMSHLAFHLGQEARESSDEFYSPNLHAAHRIELAKIVQDRREAAAALTEAAIDTVNAVLGVIA